MFEKKRKTACVEERWSEYIDAFGRNFKRIACSVKRNSKIKRGFKFTTSYGST